MPIAPTTALKSQKAELEAILASVFELLVVLTLGGRIDLLILY